MRKRVLTIILSVMTVSTCTVLFTSCGRKAAVAELPQQKAAASEVVELPALQLVESFAPETDSAIEVRSEQTEESIAPEIDSDIEGLSEQIAESIAPEVSTDFELTSEQIAEELMSHAWAGSLGDEHYSIVFDSDNYARHTLAGRRHAQLGTRRKQNYPILGRRRTDSRVQQRKWQCFASISR